jgi:hypothetical protein
MTAVGIKEKFSNLGLDIEVVDQAWKRAQRKLGDQKNVAVSGKKYRWKGNEGKATPGEPATLPEVEVTATEKPGAQEPLPDDSSEELGEMVDTTAQPKEMPGSAEIRVEEPSQEIAEEELEGRPADAPVSLAEAIAAALGDEPVPDLLTYASRPLSTGCRLGELDEAQIDHLLASVRDEERAHAVALLVPLPQAAKAIDARGLTEVPAETMREVMVASTAELRGRLGHPDSRAAAGRLLQRVSDLPMAPQSLLAFIRLAAAFAVDANKGELAVLERAAHALHGWLNRTTREDVEAVEPEMLARVAVDLPLTSRGGRAALLVAVGRLWPEQVANEIWWRNVTLTALADSATGILGRVTSQHEVAERVIAPLMARELAKTASRVRLASLLALPHEFVASLPAEGVANAFRRVALDDPLVDSWVGGLTGTSQVARLKEEAEQVQAELQRAHERAEQAEKEARELAARCARFESLLRQQHERSVDLRAAQERQLKIDIVRALADLAADVEELAVSGATPEILVERVRALVSNEELEAIGAAGAQASFDPKVHEPLVGAPEEGEPVTVLRPGYRWRSEEDTLLSRALVSLAQP